MKHIHWLRIAITALFMATLVPLPASALQSETSFTSEMFDYTVEWTGNWTPEGAGESSGGVLEVVPLIADVGFIVVTAYDGGRFQIPNLMEPAEGAELVDEDRDADVPFTLVKTSTGVEYTEYHAINDGEVIITITAYGDTNASANRVITKAEADVTVNGSPVFAGQPLADGEPSEQTSTGVTRTRRTAGTQATEEPTDEPTAATTRTRRTANTQQATETPSNLTTFEGPVYNYSLQYDATIWEEVARFEDEKLDGLRLLSDNGRLTIFVWDIYGTDTVACLDGEVAYYTEEDDNVTKMELVESNGEPIRYESEESSWGVYSVEYTRDGTTTPLVDYIECRSLPEQGATMVIMFSATPETYNTGLDQSLDVVDTVAIGEGERAQTATEVPATEAPTTEGETIATLDGSFYTSPNYGYTVDVPLEWDILEENVDGTNERLVLGNGTSVVTLWATSDYQGNLAGCVDYGAQQSGLDLSLDTNASGGDFRGVYRNEAYANFVYDDGGTKMLYFVSCKPIPNTNGVLILIQDVEYTRFATERRPRVDIENNITMP